MSHRSRDLGSRIAEGLRRGRASNDSPFNEGLCPDSSVSPIEISTAMFNLGYELDYAGRREDADEVYRQTIELLESISEKQDSSLQMSDLANLAYDHGIKLFRIGRYSKARLAFERCLEIMDSLIVLDASSQLVERLALVISWVARTQRKTGQLKQALASYQRAGGVWRSLLSMSQHSVHQNRLRNYYSTALLGQAKTYRAMGRNREAEDLLQAFAETLGLVIPKEAISWE
jgi:tetratricopeptide (TPR) repeat protein